MSPAENSTVLSISELAELVKSALNKSFGTEGLWIKGVVASYSANSSGHHYLELQEFSELGSTSPSATISCVIWKLKAPILLGQLKDTQLGAIRNGLSLVVRVKPNFWTKGGRLSFQIEDLDVGLSQVANLQEKEKIRKRLRELGIWHLNRELALPQVPLSIGLVTAQGSAAESDFLGELARSDFAFKVTYCPASTAGDAAPRQIARSISRLRNLGMDLICLVRGGGSMSDLSVFDSEPVVAAVAGCTVPVWVGIGHSTDTTLVEEVANRFLDVPQSVARAVVNQVRSFSDQVDALSARIHAVSHARADLARLELAEISSRMLRGPMDLLRDNSVFVNTLCQRTIGAARLTCARAESELAGSITTISRDSSRVCETRRYELVTINQSLKDCAKVAVRAQAHLVELCDVRVRSSDPDEMALKGFALLADNYGTLIRSINALKVGGEIRGRIAQGEFNATINDIDKGSDEPS